MQIRYRIQLCESSPLFLINVRKLPVVDACNDENADFRNCILNASLIYARNVNTQSKAERFTRHSEFYIAGAGG